MEWCSEVRHGAAGPQGDVDLSIHAIASDEASLLDAGATSFFRNVLEDGGMPVSPPALHLTIGAQTRPASHDMFN